MRIPKEYLEEKNYEGARLVEITDPRVLALNEELAKFRPIAKPHLDVMAELGKKLDPYYNKIREYDAKKQKIKDKMQPTLDKFNAELKKMEEIEQKTDLIKQKIQPLVNKIVEKEVGELETARQLIEKDGKIFVEIIDEVEEKIKAVRAIKTKK